VVRNRLKRIQYRPALIDGFLAQTGLSLANSVDPVPGADRGPAPVARLVHIPPPAGSEGLMR